MSGPLPDPNRRRRNAPVIPTTSLPLSGTGEDAPDVPSWADLGVRGSAWWVWAWASPQAAAWGVSVGFESIVARRASLEDDFVRADDYRGRLAVMREMRELDDRLGLSPKGMAALRWTIVDDRGDTAAASDGDNVTSITGRRSRLAAADAS